MYRVASILTPPQGNASTASLTSPDSATSQAVTPLSLSLRNIIGLDTFGFDVSLSFLPSTTAYASSALAISSDRLPALVFDCRLI